jgi:tetratricopeptide (TPR) repeat protein
VGKESWLWFFRRLCGHSADPAYYITEGDKAFLRGDLPRALRAYEVALDLDPERWEAYEKRGTVRIALKEFDKALADLEVAISHAADPTIAFQNRACVYEELGKPELALADYGRAIERTPDYWPAFFNRAMLMAKLGRAEEAVADFRRLQHFALPTEELGRLREELAQRGIRAEPVNGF